MYHRVVFSFPQQPVCNAGAFSSFKSTHTSYQLMGIGEIEKAGKIIAVIK